MMWRMSINVSFKNKTNESHHFKIWDIAIDPHDPKQIYDDYLDAKAQTDPLAVHEPGEIKWRHDDYEGEAHGFHEGEVVEIGS
jgi:hypothetical protein